MADGRFVTEEYIPGWRFYFVLVALIVTSVVVGFYVAFQFEWEETSWFSISSWLLTAILAGLVGPDLAQYSALRRFGSRPRRVRWIERQNSPLFAWWRAPDRRLTRAQFAVAYVFPVLLSGVVLLAYVLRFPTTAPILGLILPFYLGNFWFALLALRRPGGTLVELLERGVRFHEPVRASSA